MNVEELQMNLKKLYLDTNLWNRLQNQRINARSLFAGLTNCGASLALSGQTVCELARTFERTPERAQDLFQCLKEYVDLGIIGAHDNMEQLHGEIHALNTGATSVVAFYGPSEYALLKAEVDKLARGIFDEQAQAFIIGRRHFAQSTRTSQVAHFTQKLKVKERLNAIPIGSLKEWLEKEMLSNQGTLALVAHLLRMYEGLPPLTAARNAHNLLRVPASRIAKGIVKADLYYNWRCATRGSNKADLVDDVYHVLNASYCDVYATAEPKQIEYAELLLSQHTQVAIYRDSQPVDEWLLELVSPTSKDKKTYEDVCVFA
jgi:hypothetical protein